MPFRKIGEEYLKMLPLVTWFVWANRMTMPLQATNVLQPHKLLGLPKVKLSQSLSQARKGKIRPSSVMMKNVPRLAYLHPCRIRWQVFLITLSMLIIDSMHSCICQTNTVYTIMHEMLCNLSYTWHAP